MCDANNGDLMTNKPHIVAVLPRVNIIRVNPLGTMTSETFKCGKWASRAWEGMKVSPPPMNEQHMEGMVTVRVYGFESEEQCVCAIGSLNVILSAHPPMASLTWFRVGEVGYGTMAEKQCRRATFRAQPILLHV